MNGQCETCGRPYGKRKRCYYCSPARKHTGETRTCRICGKEFHAAKWQLDDTVRNQGVYCSRKCKHKAMEIDGPGSRRKRWDGYIEVYYPKHPDAPKGGWMLEHRLVAEQKYGRRIGKGEHIHHIDGMKDNNNPDNLEILDPSTHAGISNKRGQQLRQAQRTELDLLRAEIQEYRALFGPIEEARQLRLIPSTPENVVRRYYAARAAGKAVTLKEVAAESPFNYEVVKKAKQRYDRDGKWGSDKPQGE
jgi:hypothetical protein